MSSTQLLRIYYEKGASTFICSKISDLLTLFLQLQYLHFALYGLTGEFERGVQIRKGCQKDLSFYIYKNPLENSSQNLWSVVVVLYLAVFSLYWVWNLFVPFLTYGKLDVSADFSGSLTN